MGRVTEAKRILDMHTNISQAIARHLSDVQYVQLWRAELEMMRGRGAGV